MHYTYVLVAQIINFDIDRYIFNQLSKDANFFCFVELVNTRQVKIYEFIFVSSVMVVVLW